jgi:hypothetical protein
MSVTTSPVSKVVIKDATIPDGLQLVSLDAADDGTSVIRKQPLTFIAGEAEINIPFATTKRVVGYQIDNAWPPQKGSVLALESVGTLELFANETWRTDGGFFLDISELVTVNGKSGPIGDNIALDSGALVNFSSSGSLTYSPRNAFNHLAEGETAIDSIPYTIAPSTWGDEAWDGLATLLEGTSIGNLGDMGDGWYSAGYDENGENYTNYPSNLLWVLGDNLKVGESYRLHWSVDEATRVEGGYNGAVEVYWMDANGEKITPINTSWPRIVANQNNTGVQEGSLSTVPVPEGAVGIYLDTTNGTRLQFKVRSVIREIPAEVFHLDILVKGSEDVGPELNDGLAWAGAGWTETDGTFLHAAGDTSPLEATVTGLMPDHIYQYVVETANATVGTVRLALGDNVQDWDIETNEPDVVTLRAASDTEILKVIPSSDFDGEVSGLSLKYIKKRGTKAADLRFVQGAGGTGQATLTWMIPTAASFTDTQTPQKVHTGELNFSNEFGVRESDVIESMHVHDATSVGKRGGVSIKGGDWFQAENVMVTGGWPEDASSWKYQVGFVLCDNGKPTMKAQMFNHCYVDLLMEPMPDNYVTQNSDGFVINGGNERFNSRMYMYDCAADGIPDGCIDQKLVGFVNQMGAYGGHRSIRAHGSTHTMAINTLTQEQEGTECAYHIGYATGRVNVYNCWYENQDGFRRIHSVSQMRNVIDDRGAFSSSYALATDESAQGGHNSFCPIRNYPRYPDFCRVHMTDMEFEMSNDGGATWSELTLPFTNDQGVIAENRRTFAIAAGTYSFRARCRNHDFIGAWSQVDDVVVV